MKILFLFDYYSPYIGGAEIVNQHIAEHFNRKHDVVVISKRFKGLTDQHHIVNGVTIHRTVNLPRLFHSIVSYFSAYRFARNSDIIFSATYASALAGMWLSKKFKKKSVLLVHEILGKNWRFFKNTSFLYYWYEKCIVTRQFDQYVAVSQYTKQKLVEYGIPNSKIRVIYNGVDEDLFYPRPVNSSLRKKIAGETSFVYLYFGRPGVSKGLEFLVKAVHHISASVSDSKLVLILGPEPRSEYKKIMQLIEKLHIKDKITVIPSLPRDQLPDYVNIADVVVIPSLSEGFGFAAAESCMLGKKIVVTDAGALPEVISGKVVRIKKADSRAIVDGVLRAYRDDYEYIPEKKFRWEHSLNQYEEVTKSLLS